MVSRCTNNSSKVEDVLEEEEEDLECPLLLVSEEVYLVDSWVRVSRMISTIINIRMDIKMVYFSGTGMLITGMNNADYGGGGYDGGGDMGGDMGGGDMGGGF